MSPQKYELDRSIPCTEVEPTHWAPGQGRHLLETHSLGPCIGVAVYDPRQQQGHIGHFINGVGISPDFINSVVTNTTDVSQVQCWVSGGELDSATDEMGLGARRLVLEELQTAGINPDNIHEHWVESFDEESASILLNCETGECEISFEPYDAESEPYEDDFED